MFYASGSRIQKAENKIAQNEMHTKNMRAPNIPIPFFMYGQTKMTKNAKIQFEAVINIVAVERTSSLKYSGIINQGTGLIPKFE